MAEAGHEIGHHSWAHIPNANQTRDEEEADLVRANENIRKLTGRTARGYRSPSWDLSPHTIDLLLKHGFLYDFEPDGRRLHSLSGAARRRGGARQAVSSSASRPTLIEMPISWSLDDHPHFEFIRTPQTVAPGLQPARAVMQSWLDEFTLHEEDGGLGRADLHHAPVRDRPRLPDAGAGMACDQLAKEGAVFMTMEQAAEEAKQRLF